MAKKRMAPVIAGLDADRAKPPPPVLSVWKGLVLSLPEGARRVSDNGEELTVGFWRD